MRSGTSFLSCCLPATAEGHVSTAPRRGCGQKAGCPRHACSRSSRHTPFCSHHAILWQGRDSPHLGVTLPVPLPPWSTALGSGHRVREEPGVTPAPSHLPTTRINRSAQTPLPSQPPLEERTPEGKSCTASTSHSHTAGARPPVSHHGVCQAPAQAPTTHAFVGLNLP